MYQEADIGNDCKQLCATIITHDLQFRPQDKAIVLQHRSLDE
jgi:hypothetical protein